MNTTRRRFLIGGLEVGLVLPIASSAAARALLGPSAGGQRVLVVLELTGGNDGLNTVVPHRQDAYYRLRPTLALERNTLHTLDDDHGLHPELGGLAELYETGHVALVHGVGLPFPERSHFRAREIWHTADPEHPPGETGWLGRLTDELVANGGSTLVGLHVGTGNLPLALRAQSAFTPTVRDPRGFRTRELGPEFERGRDLLLDGPSSGSVGASADLAFLRDAARTTYRAAERMRALVVHSESGGYPDTELGRRLRLVAQLVVGDFGTRIFHVALDGFDTHSRQAGPHAGLLAELDGALAAFQRDLTRRGAEDRVVTLVHSEFGRRATENGSAGTDHGAGAPVFLVGGAVRGGAHGTAPDLERTVEGDVAATTDFRTVYAALERGWLGSRNGTGARKLDLLRT